jgi:aminoglycoside 6'-N-acetyltransferase I
MDMVEIGAEKHLDEWARLRSLLWPESSIEAHRAELARLLSAGDRGTVASIASTGSGGIVGFAEASLRTDYVNGCETSPVTFLEGIYVAPDHRGAGIAMALCVAVGACRRAAGCREMASDADVSNTVNHAFHGAVGFAETERVVFFRKALVPEREGQEMADDDPGQIRGNT